MKRNHSPSGKSIAIRAFVYSISFLALIGIRENINNETGPVSQAVGTTFNEALKAASKVGLGIALLSKDDPGNITWVGQNSKKLGRASHEAFVCAAKIEIYAR